VDLADSYNIEIANENILFPFKSDAVEVTDRSPLEPYVDEIWSTNVRIVFLLIGPRYADAVLDMFVEKGAKEGDLIILGTVMLTGLDSHDKTVDEVEDWEKLMLGSLNVQQSYRTGEVGEWYK
jgi:hypothetical protein